MDGSHIGKEGVLEKACSKPQGRHAWKEKEKRKRQKYRLAKMCSVEGCVGVVGIMEKKMDLCKRTWLPTTQAIHLPDLLNS